MKHGMKKDSPTPPTLPNFGQNPQEAALYRSAASEHRAAAAGLPEGGRARPRPWGACSGGDCGGSGDGKLAYFFVVDIFGKC